MSKIDKVTSKASEPHAKPDPIEVFDIRCHHIDYTQPSHEPGEFKWRCPIWFPYDQDAVYWARAHCPHHRELYRPGLSVPPEQVRQAQHLAHAMGQKFAMPASVQTTTAGEETDEHLPNRA